MSVSQGLILLVNFPILEEEKPKKMFTEIENTLTNFAEDNKDLCVYLKIDCKNQKEDDKKYFVSCQNSNLKDYPTIDLYQPPIIKTVDKGSKVYSHHRNQYIRDANINIDNLKKNIEYYMPYFRYQIKNENEYVQFETKQIERAKILYVNNSVEIPFWFKQITVKYKDHIIFGVINGSDPNGFKILQNMKIGLEHAPIIYSKSNLVENPIFTLFDKKHEFSLLEKELEKYVLKHRSNFNYQTKECYNNGEEIFNKKLNNIKNSIQDLSELDKIAHDNKNITISKMQLFHIYEEKNSNQHYKNLLAHSPSPIIPHYVKKSSWLNWGSQKNSKVAEFINKLIGNEKNCEQIFQPIGKDIYSKF